MNAHDANTPFRALMRSFCPSWADWEAADEAGRAKIERRWRNDWMNDEAHKLLVRAGYRRAEEAQRAAEQKADEWARRWIEKMKIQAPWLLNKPLWGWRDVGLNDETLIDRNSAHSEGWGHQE